MDQKSETPRRGGVPRMSSLQGGDGGILPHLPAENTPSIRLAVSEGPSTNTSLENLSLTLEEFGERLQRPEIGPKEGSYFLRAAVRDGMPAVRGDANIEEAGLVVLDCDSRVCAETGTVFVGAPDPAAIHEALGDMDLAHVLFSTHSHGQPGKGNRCRAVLDVTVRGAEELRAVVDHIIAELHARSVMLAPAKENYTWSQPWYFPRVPDEQAREAFRYFEHLEGATLDVASIVASYRANQPSIPLPKGTHQARRSDSPIGRFNAAHGSPEAILERLQAHGYALKHTCNVNGGIAYRLLRPGSVSGMPGVCVYRHRNGGKWLTVSHHGAEDPLAGDGDPKARDAFDLFRILEHGGDEKAALHAIRANAHAISGKKPYRKSFTSFTSFTDKGSILHSEGGNPPLPSLGGQSPAGFLCFEDDEGELRLVAESEAAKELAQRIRDDFAYNTAAGEWHAFGDAHWKPVSSAEPEERIVKLLFDGCSPKGFKQSYQSGVSLIMRRGNLIPLGAPLPGRIPFRNGLLDIATGKLEPVTRATAHTWCIPHDYRSGAACPFFRKWLGAVTNDDMESARLLVAYVNACLHGRADLQKFLNLLGPGGTGKSTFMRLLVAILGADNCATTDLKNLEGNRFESSKLYGKRLAMITDSSKYGGTMDVLKAITGQDWVRNEKKNIQQGRGFIFEGMVVLASNEPLQSTDYTSGLARRSLVLTINKRFTQTEKDAFNAAGGEGRLHAEIPEIINLALKMKTDEVTQIFSNPPKAAQAATLDALLSQNPVVDWMNANLIAESGSFTAIGVRREIRPFGGGSITYEDEDTKLYPNYLRWCRENGREALCLRRFRNTVMDMCGMFGWSVIAANRACGHGVQGLRLKRATDGPSSEGFAAGSDGFSEGFDGLEAAEIKEVKDMRDFCELPLIGGTHTHTTARSRAAPGGTAWDF